MKYNKIIFINRIIEELRLDFPKEKFIEYDSGCDGKDCYKMYLVNKDIDLKDIKIQKDKLSLVNKQIKRSLRDLLFTSYLLILRSF